MALIIAKVENQIIELLAKSSVTNVYLEDGTTTLASKLAEMMTAIDSKTTPDAVATQIQNAIDGLIDGAPGTYDTLKEIADYLATHNDEYTALVEVVGSKASQVALDAVIERVVGLETKMTTIEEGAQVNIIEKVKVNGVEQEITGKAVDISVPTGALASKDKITEADLDETLAEKVNASDEASHTHDNKTVLDGITEDDVNAWNAKTNTYIQASQPTELKEGDIWIQIVE